MKKAFVHVGVQNPFNLHDEAGIDTITSTNQPEHRRIHNRRDDTGDPSMRAGLIFLASSALAGFACQIAWADKLPNDAVELTAEEVKAIYSGTTGVYAVSSEYYAPDGTTKGIFGKPKITSTFRGTWQVNGNEICAKNKAKGDPKVYTDCNKFWRSGKKLYSLWSTHYDGSKPDTKNGYYTNELKYHKKGDLVSKEYAAAGGE